jgi:ferredoxin-NADP reductase/predicted pyridoxine 5'-phosphate oxidase superfamily flavin-nucleotide-binding protein
MLMDAGVREFIQSATLLFIASKSPEGTLDVSPRGGQPSVLWPDEQGRLLLPDYMGNKRLDTIGNLLGNPEVMLIILSRGANRFLRIKARAQVSTRAEDIAIFPADQNRPMTAIVLEPIEIEFIESTAFDGAGFWLDPSARKPPLDMIGYYHSDKTMHRDAGRPSVPKPTIEESRLIQAGIRDLYGTPSELVQTKVYEAIGPGGLAFIDEALFIILASVAGDGGIRLDVVGGQRLELNPAANRQSFRLHLPEDAAGVKGTGECAIVAAVPGRLEALRMNGPYRSNLPAGRDRSIEIAPDEIFFHCSAALTRSRIWAEPLSAAWSGLRSFRISSTRDENPEVKSFNLEPLDAAPIGEIQPGQYVTIAVPGDATQPPRRRNYSVSGRPADRMIRISVRKVSDDGLSGLLHGLSAGDEVQVGVPAGRFVFKSPPQRSVVFVSAGVGITPLLPMLQTVVAECAERYVWFVHAARDTNYHLFADEVRELSERSGGRVKLLSAYSRATEDETCDHRGRIDAELLDRLVPATDADFYICGPDAFMASLRKGLVALGADTDNIHFEAFGASGEGMAEKLAGLPDRKIVFTGSGKEVTWQPTSGSLLDLALSNGIKVQYSCRNGDCQSCIQKLVSGVADYPMGELPVLAEDQILLCQAVPKSDMVLGC